MYELIISKLANAILDCNQKTKKCKNDLGKLKKLKTSYTLKKFSITG